MFSIASAVSAGPSGTRSRTNAALAGSLAKMPEGRQVADRVAGDDGRERRAKGQAMRRLETQRPGGGAHRKPQAGERDDGHQAPANLSEPAPDFPEPDFRHEPGEEHEAERGGDDADEIRASWTGTFRPGLGKHAVII